MRARMLRIAAAVLLPMILICGLMIHAAALDDTYRFDDLGLSMKLSKSFNVITRDTPRGDEVFAAVDLDYDETMTAFHAANIYLRAYESENLYQISLTVTKDDNSAAVNNYSDLTAAQRKSILDTLADDASVSSAVEVKHNGNIFFDYDSTATVGGEDVYISQCNTVINGMQIDLSMQKNGEAITAEEQKVLVNAANSMSFDNIKRNTGPAFDWWRLLLWGMILVVISVLVSLVYKHNNEKKRLLEERRKRREGHNPEAPAPAEAEERRLTFEETLGYSDDEEFAARADADEMAGYDINVKGSDPSKGIAYFEDAGESINDGSDYFDTYFKEPTEKRTFTQRVFSKISTYFSIVLDHTGYFFKNLFKRIFGKKKK